jgi:hypothetical protein
MLPAIVAALRDALLCAVAQRIAELEDRRAVDGSGPPPIEERDPLLRKPGLPEIDPLFRPFARRIYRRARRTARAALPDGAGELDLCRLTFLALVGDPVADLAEDDRRGERLSETWLRARRHVGPRRLRVPSAQVRRPIPSLIALVFLLAATGSTWALVTHLRLVAPHGVYASGGDAPPQNAVLDRVLVEAWPAYVTALSQRQDALPSPAGAGSPDNPDADLAKARDAIDQAAGEVPDDGRLREALDQLARDASALDATDPAELRADARAVDGVLMEEGAPYFIDVDVIERPNPAGDPEPELLSGTYRVDHVTLYRVAGHDYRALRLRRLDRLAFARSLLGFTAPDEDAALVLEDPARAMVLNQLIPTLGGAGGASGAASAPSSLPASYGSFMLVPGSHNGLVDRAGRDAGIAMRRDFAGTLSGLSPDARDLLPTAAALLGARRTLFDGLARGLPADELLHDPDTLALDDEQMRELAASGTPPLGTTPSWTQLLDLNEKLRTLDASSPSSDLLDTVTNTVLADLERHEVLHRHDYDDPPSTPPALAQLMGPADPGPATLELSAYAGELSQDGCPEGLAVALLSRYLLDPSQSGLDEAPAAIVLFEGLVGYSLRTGDGADQTLDRDAAAEAVSALLAQDPDQLRQRARLVYRQLFGIGAPVVEQTSP